MSRGDAASPRRRRWLRRLTAALVALVVVALLAGGAAYQFDLVDRWFGQRAPSPVTQPALVLPPPGLSLPAAPSAAPVAATTPGRPVDRAAVRRALEPLLRKRKLGRHVVAEVVRLSDGAVAYRRGSGPVIPASTTKVLTATAVLQALGPAHRFSTTVVPGRQRGSIVLVGGGDPLLARAPDGGTAYPARADLDTLARRAAAALWEAGRRSDAVDDRGPVVRLGYDTSLFDGPTVNPRWEASYLPDDVVSPITPLWVDQGRERAGFSDRVRDPALAAARVFSRALRTHGVTVRGPVTPAAAPRAVDEADGAAGVGQPLARVRSAPLAALVQHVLEVSDNEGAEVLARQVAVATGRPASFTGASKAVLSVLRDLGVPTTGATVYDGSGLSRDNRLPPETIIAVLRAASGEDRPELRSAVTTLPVAGFTGSLASRFDTGSPWGRGTVRAKTGTLTGVHGLAGTVTTRDGAVLAFVAVADRVKPRFTLDARAAIDQAAAALAGCDCARDPE